MSDPQLAPRAPGPQPGPQQPGPQFGLPPQGRPSDVIHDIGYRHYAGPRLGRAYATRSLYVHGLRGAFGLGRSAKSKILPMLLLAAVCVPALIVVAVAVYLKSKHMPIEYTRYLSIVDFVVAVFAAAQAPVLFSRDLRFNTVPLYFSRPLTAADYVRARLGAMTSAVLVLTALPVLILWIGSLLGSMSFGYNLHRLASGLLAAVLYALVYGGIASVIASTTARRGFGVAGIIGVFLISGAVSGVVYALLDRNGNDAEAAWSTVIDPGGLVSSVADWITRIPAGRLDQVPSTLGGLVFTVEVLALIAGAFALLVRRYRTL